MKVFPNILVSDLNIPVIAPPSRAAKELLDMSFYRGVLLHCNIFSNGSIFAELFDMRAINAPLRYFVDRFLLCRTKMS
ncbi:MAG: hypothetical protein EOP71_04425 [Variovorax sp.]|jgi:hypothetical protein|nr:MAG: hypothetical protein EOP71_04425 [Variovorax sp.]